MNWKEFIEKAYSWNNSFPNGLDGVFVDVDTHKLTFNLGSNAKSRYAVAGLLEGSPELKYVGTNGFREYIFEWVGS